MQNFDLDIVLPCYNPQQNWPDIIVSSCEKLDSLFNGLKYRIIVVNDGSKKGITEEVVVQLRERLKNIRIIGYPVNKGKGFALRAGVSQSAAPYVIITDIDIPYLEENIISFYNKLKDDKTDIICGTRNDFYYRDVPPLRKKISKILKKLNRNFLNLKVEDTQCGIKGFNRKGKEIFLKTTINRYLFDLEFIFLSSNDMSVRIEGQRVSLKPEIVFSKMNYKIIALELLNFVKIIIKNIFGVKNRDHRNDMKKQEACRNVRGRTRHKIVLFCIV